jgi:cytochrome c-type biogenesis protein CcmF
VDARRAAGAGIADKPFAIAMFCCAGFVFGSVGQEFFRGARARRAMAGESPPRALLALVRRNRRRYGGYIVHLGIAVLFVGVAASSSFQHAAELAALARPVDTRVGAYKLTYVRPTATITPKYDQAHTGSTLSLGALIDVSKGGHHVATLNPSEGFYASQDASQGSVGSLIGGQPVSHISDGRGRDQGRLERDRTGHRSASPGAIIVKAGNRTLPPEEALVGDRLPGPRIPQAPSAAQFHFIVSPLVMWIWLGGLIVFGGGLIAIWPAPSVVRRRVAVRVGARTARA